MCELPLGHVRLFDGWRQLVSVRKLLRGNVPGKHRGAELLGVRGGDIPFDDRRVGPGELFSLRGGHVPKWCRRLKLRRLLSWELLVLRGRFIVIVLHQLHCRYFPGRLRVDKLRAVRCRDVRCFGWCFELAELPELRDGPVPS